MTTIDVGTCRTVAPTRAEAFVLAASNAAAESVRRRAARRSATDGRPSARHAMAEAMRDGGAARTAGLLPR